MTYSNERVLHEPDGAWHQLGHLPEQQHRVHVGLSGDRAPTTVPSTTTRISGAVYLDASFTCKFGSVENVASEVYLNVRNLTNKDPVIVAPGPVGSRTNRRRRTPRCTTRSAVRTGWASG